MLSWILIALIIALIFGVIKIDDLKKAAADLLPKLKTLFNQLVAFSQKKANELKAGTAKKETPKAIEQKDEKAE